MTTYRDIINQSLQELGVLHAGEVATGDDANDSFKRLNQMLNSWVLFGLDLEYITPTNIDTDVPYPEDHIGPFAYNLAARLSTLFGVSASAELLTMAENGYRQLQNRYLKAHNLSADVALLRRPNDTFYS